MFFMRCLIVFTGDIVQTVTDCADKQNPCNACLRKKGWIVSSPSYWPVGLNFWEKTPDELVVHAYETEHWWKFPPSVLYRPCEYIVDPCPPADPYVWYGQPSDKEKPAEYEEDSPEDEAFCFNEDGSVEKLSKDELSRLLSSLVVNRYM